MGKGKQAIRKYPNGTALAVSMGVGMILGFGWSFLAAVQVAMGSGSGYGNLLREALFAVFFIGGITGLFLVYPLALTGLNLSYLLRKGAIDTRRSERITENTTIVLGVLYTILYDGMFSGYTNGIQFRSDWQEVLYNGQMHTPVWTQAVWTVIVLSLVGIAGYLLLSLKNVNRMPPLLTVCGIAAVYVGILMCVLWIIQVVSREWIFCIFPANCVLIGLKTVRRTVEVWQGNEENRTKVFQNSVLSRLNENLMDASRWPAAAFLVMLPMLGAAIGILTLFGQQPDSIIKAWTETSDWNLSQKTAPPNVFYDEHYLCTVAAQGHPDVVKPLRKGIRHGHTVTVNRQLCIANAFEQVLEERVPWLHKPVRQFYDRYGFPVARLIHSENAADVVYYIMKPLEWIFLAVLYLTDVKPENRIAVQYPHAPLPEREIYGQQTER